MSIEHVADVNTIKILKILFQELEIHFSPFAQEDEYFYNKTGFPRPNPHFPPPTDSHYHFCRWGQGGENFIAEDV
ncbi:MAG: hypothetical protein GY706_12300 [Bacteroides sp.]|nr:hypothetical protein [Bacteroides sp.]